MATPIAINTKTTIKDFRSLTYFNLFFKKKSKLIFMICGGLISLSTVTGNLTGLVKVESWYFYVCLAFLGLILMQFGVTESGIKKFLMSDKFIINQERKYIIDDEGIHEEGKVKGSGNYSFNKLHMVYETKPAFYFYLNTMQAVIVPKRDISEEQAQEIKTLLKTKMGKKFK